MGSGADVIRITIDTNVLINAQNDYELDHEKALNLITLYKAGSIDLHVMAASAAENHRSMIPVDTSSRVLLEELSRLEISNQPIQNVWTLGIGALGYMSLATIENVALIQNVWQCLFSGLPLDHTEFCKNNPLPAGNELHPKWRNKMCDVLTVVGYIDDCKKYPADRNILISKDDDDIVKRAPKLKKLGASEILGLTTGLSEIRAAIS